MSQYREYKDSGFRPLESRLMPLVDNDLTPPGKRSGEGLASILPYLVKALRGKPRDPAPQAHGTADSQRPSGRP